MEIIVCLLICVATQLLHGQLSSTVTVLLFYRTLQDFSSAINMSTLAPQSEDVALTEAATQQIEEIAESIRQGKEEEAVIQLLKRLPHNPGWKIEEWRQPSSSLNLLQLAVLHRRRNVVDYLWVQHRHCLKKDLYWTTSCVDQDGSAASQESVSHSDQPLGQPAAFLHTGPAQQPSVQQTTSASQLSGQKQSTQQLKEEQWQLVLVNHPLHLACWLGDVDIVRCLTRPCVNTAESQKFSHHQDHSSHTTAEDQLGAEIQDLMKSVSMITVDAVTAYSKTVRAQGLPLELAVSSGSVGCVKHLLAKVLLRWVSSRYYFLCVAVERKAVVLHLACCFSAPKVVAFLLSTMQPG